jgi:hypothetical protein
MYGLQFGAAQREFQQWQQEHPGDPMGPVSEAANYLFAEFDRLGVLEAQFFVKDSSFKSRTERRMDEELQARFEAALARAEELARRQLDPYPEDQNSLFALALVYGLRADHAALIAKRNFAALGYTKEASEIAARLLEVAPESYDAYLSTGIAKFIFGSMPFPVRWVLRLAGYRGDRDGGLRELQLTAEKGRFLAPFARILLAIAHLRQDNRAHALEQLTGLRAEFPTNPLFSKEIARIESMP